MEEVFILALANRAKEDESILQQLSDGVKKLVLKRIADEKG